MENSKTAFIDSTLKALSDVDLEKLIECLSKREAYKEDMIRSGAGLEEDEARELLAREVEILEKLKKERAKLLKEMDTLSKGRKASQAYSPKFPFPSMPLFFNKIE